MNEVATAKLFRRQTHSLSNYVHVSLEREDALRRSKSSERTVRRNVGRNCLAVNPHVGTNVWTSGMNRSAREHDRRKRAVSAAIDDEVDLHREKFSVFSHGSFVMRSRRMTLRSRHHIFRTVVDHLDRLA